MHKLAGWARYLTPDGATLIGDDFYLVVETHMNPTEAIKHCEGIGAHFLKGETATDLEAYYTFLNRNNSWFGNRTC